MSVWRTWSESFSRISAAVDCCHTCRCTSSKQSYSFRRLRLPRS
jgi:hypothetical protein